MSMIFGVPVEIRQNENRVGALPFVVEELVKRGHQVYVESKAGVSSGYSDEEYEQAGALIVPSAEKLYAQADVILKVQSPNPVEYDLIRPEHTLFGFFNFLNNLDIARTLVGRGCTCFAYDFYTLQDDSHPIADSQAYIAGQVALHQGIALLTTPNGGKGILPNGIFMDSPARVMILGASVAGLGAAEVAARLGMKVFVLDSSYQRLHKIIKLPYQNVRPMMFSDYTLRKLLPSIDILICANQPVFTRAEKVISKNYIQLLAPGSVVIDLDIDRGGCVETSHAMTFENPIIIQEEVIHYCVPHLPGAVPITASPALSNALLPCILKFQEKGMAELAKTDEEFSSGLVIFEGRITNQIIAEELNLPYYEINGNDNES